jgi:hypothetical protein
LIVCHTERAEIINSHTNLTDLTDFYIPLNSLILCPAEIAERAEILLPCGLGDIWDLLRREPKVAANGEKQIWQNLIHN